MTPLRLYVNIDHVATVRQARRTDEPDPAAAARAALAGGADGITVHLREDRRHIQDADVIALADSLQAPLNFELATSDEIVDLACRLRPYQATLVPERREEVTTEGGLRVSSRDARLRTAIRRLDEAGCRVSLFIDPTLDAIDAAKDLGVPAVELHTGDYAHRWRDGSGALEQLRHAARHAADLGLAVHAGHGLTYVNVGPVAAVPDIEELNIGHSIVSRAVFEGMEAAVREMQRLLTEARTVSRPASPFPGTPPTLT
ncbi:MAG TPA: pyridoxine 5'-phosphate synthase [Gemmatimonadales bacterium]|nr:pyridoxine 5'-phosphate synthase [Gemmatimonadales bacterium]